MRRQDVVDGDLNLFLKTRYILTIDVDDVARRQSDAIYINSDDDKLCVFSLRLTHGMIVWFIIIFTTFLQFSIPNMHPHIALRLMHFPPVLYILYIRTLYTQTFIFVLCLFSISYHCSVILDGFLNPKSVFIIMEKYCAPRVLQLTQHVFCFTNLKLSDLVYAPIYG